MIAWESGDGSAHPVYVQAWQGAQVDLHVSCTVVYLLK